MNKSINEHIFEIRYKPNPKILDYRGVWAEHISEHMDLSEWKIMGNRIDVYDKLNKNHAFVGFFNTGFLCSDSVTKNYFYDHAVKLYSFVSRFDGFEKDPLIDRIGVRSKFYTVHDKSFDDLKDRFLLKYAHLTSEASKLVDAKLIDVGFSLNFADKFGNFNTMTGPMDKGQAVQIFNNRKVEDFLENGLYFDIDYFLKPNKKMKTEEVTTTIRNFADSAWERHEKIKNLILGE